MWSLRNGVIVDPKKIEAIREWNRPTSLFEVRCFIYFASYYRWFVEEFSTITTPKMILTQNKVSFQWYKESELIFWKLMVFLRSVS